MRVRPSAFKNEIPADDSIHGARTTAFVAPLDDEHPQRELHLGFDSRARLLEIVVLIWDDATEEIIHSMIARKTYRKLLD